MVLSQTSQYALRAMTRLAALPAGAAARARDLSTQTAVPPHYLSKILRRLVEAKLLESEKGHHGGFRLAIAAQRIAIADILQAVDEQLELEECAFGYPRCDPRRPCPLHPVYAELKKAVRVWAEHTTLADAIVMPELLRLPPAPAPRGSR